MTTAGMEIYDANGVLQVSTNFLSYFCRRSGTGTTITRQSGNTVPSSAVIDVTGYTNPIVAFICGSNMAFTGRNGASLQNLVYACSGAISTSYSYYVFDQSSNLPAAHVGMELYNDSGQITFNTDGHPMLALATIVSDTGTAQTFTGKTVAVAPATWGGNRRAGPLECTDGARSIWDGSSYCSNLVYANFSDAYGGSAVTTTVTPGTVSYDNVDANGGSSAAPATIPPDYDSKVTMFIIDVTGIPTSTTFF